MCLDSRCSNISIITIYYNYYNYIVTRFTRMNELLLLYLLGVEIKEWKQPFIKLAFQSKQRGEKQRCFFSFLFQSFWMITYPLRIMSESVLSERSGTFFYFSFQVTIMRRMDVKERFHCSKRLYIDQSVSHPKTLDLKSAEKFINPFQILIWSRIGADWDVRCLPLWQLSGGSVFFWILKNKPPRNSELKLESISSLFFTDKIIFPLSHTLHWMVVIWELLLIQV